LIVWYLRGSAPRAQRAARARRGAVGALLTVWRGRVRARSRRHSAGDVRARCLRCLNHRRVCALSVVRGEPR